MSLFRGFVVCVMLAFVHKAKLISHGDIVAIPIEQFMCVCVCGFNIPSSSSFIPFFPFVCFELCESVKKTEFISLFSPEKCSVYINIATIW